MNSDDPISDHIYGANSNQWLRKILLSYVPQTMLWYGITRMMDYSEHNPEPDYDTGIDILIQYAVTGQYTPTYTHQCESPEDHLFPHLDPTQPGYGEEPPEPMSEEDQQRVMDEFHKIMGQVPEKKEDDDE